jgi:ankyrin repeat protein
MVNYYEKYLKYKNKYIELKNQYGGGQKLIDAIRNQNVEFVRRKLENNTKFIEKILGHNIISKSDSNSIDEDTRKSALHIACEMENPEIVDLLLKNGAHSTVSYGRHKRYHKLSNRITVNLPTNFEDIRPIDVAIENRKLAIDNKNRIKQQKNERIMKLLFDHKGFSIQYPKDNKLLNPINEEDKFLDIIVETPKLYNDDLTPNTPKY